MNRSIKQLLTVIVIALMISLTMTTMSRVCLAIPCGTCRLNTSDIIGDVPDPNEIPVESPEMTPGNTWINAISLDPNEIPEMPEMVAESSWSNVINQDPNEMPEMVPNI